MVEHASHRRLPTVSWNPEISDAGAHAHFSFECGTQAVAIHRNPILLNLSRGWHPMWTGVPPPMKPMLKPDEVKGDKSGQ